MTTQPGLADLLPIALDISASLSSEDRSSRLVDAVRRALPCDAAALLRLEGDELVPIASHGLSEDVLGRRFRRTEHPRLDIICSTEGPTLFPADSPLPDPYDGLVDGVPDLNHHLHSCLGFPLRVDGNLIGVLTVDALVPGAFDHVGDEFLRHLAALAGAALRTSDLIDTLERHARHQGLIARNLVQDVLQRRGGLLIGRGEAMERLRREIDLVAKSDFPVLVSGETGVGKELAVRTLHASSPRADAPLVYVNCAALPESIAESELFGYAPGAFTGAVGTRPGKFRVADGASLFLDEIGELPLHVQPKLLRALQDGEIQPLGLDHPVRVDVRILAATNRDLPAEVEAGRFRADLLHRLDVCRIRVPALREHPEDIPHLSGHFADRARQTIGTGPVRFSADVQDALMTAEWPGNVRELENVISRGVLRASARVTRGETVVVDSADLGTDGGAAGPARAASRVTAAAAGETPLREAVRSFQKDVIREALRAGGGNWAAAARALGMDRGNLHHLATRLGLRRAGRS